MLDKSDNPEVSKNNCNSSKAFQLMCPQLARICWVRSTGFLFFDSCDQWKSPAYLRFYYQFKIYFYMEIIVAIIPISLVTNSLLSSFVPFYILKTRINFSASWWPGNKKYFYFLFMVSRALLISHAESNRRL